MGKLQNKVAIITGSGSGMGRAAAIMFAAEGAKIVVADFNEKGGNEVVAEIKAAGNEASFFKIDVSDVEQIKEMVAFTVKTYGKINILWNNAGIPGPKGIDGVTVADWDKTMNINLRSNFFAVQAAYPELNKAAIADGCTSGILLTASVGGMVASAVSPLYGTAKGGQINLTRSLAAALGPHIRVNCICPGTTDTPLFPSFKFDHPENETPESIQAFKDSRCSLNVLERMQQPEEIAALGLFLVSNDNQFITGAIIPSDAGVTAK